MREGRLHNFDNNKDNNNDNKNSKNKEAKFKRHEEYGATLPEPNT